MKNKFLYIKEQCKVCGGKGYTWDLGSSIEKDPLKSDPIQCSCLKKMMLYMQLQAANVPREYYDLTLNDFKIWNDEKAKIIKPRIENIIKDTDSFFQQGKSLFFYGENGTGKTMLSVEILKAALKKKYSIHYEFYPIIYEAFAKKGYKADEVKDKFDEIFSNTDFLVIDELGKELEDGNKNTSSRLLEIHILKKRADKPTILISNFSNGKKEAANIYGQHVASMLSFNYEFMHVPGVDYRGEENG